MNHIRIILFLIAFGSSHLLFAQQSKNDTIRVGAIVIGDDTLPHIWIRDVFITEKAPKWAIKQRRQRKREEDEYNRLRYNVYVVYPYAVAASFILQDVDSVLNSLYSKEAKSQFKRQKENELNKKFKDELKNMSIEQGQLLVKLIARETGKPCYEIVKEMKGGFNAAIWQTVAVLFNNNLRNEFDPTGEDATIEQIVQEILSRGHFEIKK
ncbi:MAG: DUF4294 domain-containing protein [Bacteroidetes bacterium]|jgi:hypothetical protein|nr:DUF4294 domain-containing protein [Bacteroidota bacterium]HMT34716.1 DUF4294 domain-containing protein [Chitinophagaceae bacterium]MBK6820829.1 DUF4294 domain-containing protein [Bacteroidota bacterium]MBK7039006.1 DUF4294 domain-containing protein [Bacteroidota bacterium]MBK7588828.1 DUF4294 domain-containing protein [Bacteroidota bacterium]